MKTPMSLSSSGVRFIQKMEGCKLTAYPDTGGVWTIGTGHTGSDVHEGLTITQAQADALLVKDIAWAVDDINRLVTAPLTQFQFDALVDFDFNEGGKEFKNSTLLKFINIEDYSSAEFQFIRWIYDNGKPLRGLLRRRCAETLLFAGLYPGA